MMFTPAFLSRLRPTPGLNLVTAALERDLDDRLAARKLARRKASEAALRGWEVRRAKK